LLLTRTTVQGDLNIWDNSHIKGNLDLQGSTMCSIVRLNSTRIDGNLNLTRTTFNTVLSVLKSDIHGKTLLNGTIFESTAEFYDSSFQQSIQAEATVSKDLHFANVILCDGGIFLKTEIHNRIDFRTTRLQGDLEFT